MTTKAREFVDFWIENSVHAQERYRTPGASQDVETLTNRCLEMAKGQGISEADLEAEVGDLAAYIREKLQTANQDETDRQRTP